MTTPSFPGLNSDAFTFLKTFPAPLEAKIPPGMPKLLKSVFLGHPVLSDKTVQILLGSKNLWAQKEDGNLLK